MPPIRIGFDASCLMSPTGLTGVGYYTLHLLEALFARGGNFDYRLFAGSARIVPGYIARLAPWCSQTRLVRWPTRLRIAMWTHLAWPPIERFMGTMDIVHGLFHLLPPSRHAKRIVTVFDLTTLRCPETHTDAGRQEQMLRHAARQADGIIAISESCRDDVVKLLGVPPERVHVVYGGVRLEEFSQPIDEDALAALRQRIGIQKDYLIHLGTLEPRKNLVRLLQAYARVHERHPDCPPLLLVGRKGWGYEPIFETVARLRLESHVHHVGYLERHEAILLLRAAFACVYPSLYEGFGLPVLEAMAAGTPVLTSNCSSLPEVAGNAALLIDPSSVEAIASGLMNLLDHRETALARVEAGLTRACEFTWDKSAAALAAVYTKVAGA